MNERSIVQLVGADQHRGDVPKKLRKEDAPKSPLMSMQEPPKVLPFPVPALLTGPGSVKQLAENIW